MDNLSYFYDLNRNRLNYITDIAADDADYTTDITTQSANNYLYDENGNLIQDTDNSISTISWNARGKVKAVDKTGTGDMEFLYDATGQRTVKIHKTNTNEKDWVKTYYIHDAMGNTVAVYENYYTNPSANNFISKFNLEEQHLYGSQRLGMIKNEVQLTERPFTSTSYNGDGTFTGVSWRSPTTNASKTTALFNKRKVGQKQFELTNHLGNVVAVVTDRKIGVDFTMFSTAGSTDDYQYNSYLNEYYYVGAGNGTHQNSTGTDNNIDYYLANTISYTEYYAFGSEMPNRSASDFRFGFNGKEKLDEWCMS